VQGKSYVIPWKCYLVYLITSSFFIIASKNQKQDVQDKNTNKQSKQKQPASKKFQLFKKKQKSKETQHNSHPPVYNTFMQYDEHHFGYKGLGTKKIEFDDEAKEYVYTVNEPELKPDEIEVKEKLIRFFRMETDVDIYNMTEQQQNEILYSQLLDIVDTHQINIPQDAQDRVFYYLFQEFIGLGKIDALMHDDDIEDISCDGVKVPLFVYHRNHESIRTTIEFDSDEELNSFVVKLSQICGKQISIFEPIVDGKLPDGSRLQTTLAKTVTKSSTFTIRRFRVNPLTPIDLLNNHAFSLDMAAYFWLILEFGCSILFCGGTASGKTTALNALSLFIPSSFKIVSIEDTREINLPHKNWIAGTSRSGFITSDKDKTAKDIDMFDLIKAALRQRPRVIIVGEVRGKEAYTLFQAMATGHLSYSTVHANDLQSLIQRLESPPISLPRGLLTSLDVLVFLGSMSTTEGKVERRIKSVVEIVKLDPATQRIISVTPFSWVSPVDDRFINHGGSNILEKIKKYKGWSTDDVIKELERRKQVLTWIQKQENISYKEFWSITAAYERDAAAVMKNLMIESL